MKRNTGTLSYTLHELFYNPKAKGFYLINDILALTTVISVLTLILETVSSLSYLMPAFLFVEYLAFVLFSLEYIGRVIANKSHVQQYTFSFFGIVDLLAILPTIFGLSSFAFLKTARVLRILRLLRMTRLAKLTNRKRKQGTHNDEDIHSYKLSVQIYFATLMSAVILSGTLVYIVEDSEVFGSIPIGMLWALKATLRIPPSAMPVTILGEVVTVLTYFFGLLLFGLLISVMGNMLKRLLLGEK